jgi:mono/diheme cytochrome c family protein
MERKLLALLTFAAFALGGCTAVSQQTTTVVAGGTMMTGDAERGKQVFAMNCAVCHGTAGVGGDIGPSLRGESERLDYSALVSWIENPQAPMPKLYPQILSEQQVLDVAAYVQRL